MKNEAGVLIHSFAISMVFSTLISLILLYFGVKEETCEKIEVIGWFLSIPIAVFIAYGEVVRCIR